MALSASTFRRVGAIAIVIVLVAIYFFVELQPKGDAMPFAPGEWVNLKASSAVFLAADGTGAADHLGYLELADTAQCPDDEFYVAYTGSVTWSWRDEGETIEFDLVDAGIGGLVLAPTGSGDWSEVAYWACGGTGAQRTYAMTRLELTDLWTPPAP